MPNLTRPALALLLLCAAPLITQTVAQTVTQTVTLQKDELPAPGGIVSGRVLLGDTGGPARFAKVLLKSTAPPSGDAANPFEALLAGMGKDEDDDSPKKSAKAAPAKPARTPEQEAERKKTEAASASVFAAIADLLVSTTVSADGTYTFTNVKPGTYYVHATVPGYIDPFTQFSSDDLTSTDPATRARIASAISTITVSATGQGRADLRLERGAAIAGRVLYDDGSPAPGWTVRVVHDHATTDLGAMSAMGVDASDMDLTHLTEVAQTDDTGHFRIAGLPTGNYVLQARLAAGTLGHSSFNASVGMGGMVDRSGLKITVYSGNTVHKSDAKPVSLRTGEERAGYDLTVPLRSEHALAGVVRAKSDGHPISAGVVQLTAQDAQGKDDPSLTLTAVIREDGTFRFDYVPGPGLYTLQAQGAADATTTGIKQVFGSSIATQKTSKHYGPATVTAQLGEGDLTDARIEVPEVSAK